MSCARSAAWRRWARHPGRRSGGTTAAASRPGPRTEAAVRRDPGDGGDDDRTGGHRDPQGDQHAQHHVLELVDVGHHAAEQRRRRGTLRARPGPAARCGEDSGAQAAEGAEGDVVAASRSPYLATGRVRAARRTPTISIAQRQDRGLLGGPADEIAGQAGQAGGGQDGHGAEADRQGQLARRRPRAPSAGRAPAATTRRRRAGRCRRPVRGRPGISRSRRRDAGDLGAGPVGRPAGPADPPAMSRTRGSPEPRTRSWVRSRTVADRSAPHAGDDLAGGDRVQVDGGLVEHEQRAAAQQGPCQPEPLLLAGREPVPTVADDGGEAVGQVVDEAVGARPERRSGSGRHPRPVGPGRCWRRPCRAAASGAAGPRPGGDASRRGRFDPRPGRRSAAAPRPGEQPEEHPAEGGLAGPAGAAPRPPARPVRSPGRRGRAPLPSVRRSAPTPRPGQARWPDRRALTIAPRSLAAKPATGTTVGG